MEILHLLEIERRCLGDTRAFGRRGKRWFPGKSKYRHKIYDALLDRIRDFESAGADPAFILDPEAKFPPFVR